MGVMNPGLVMRNIIPVVMAGVLGIYGLIVAVIIQGSSKTLSHLYYPMTESFYQYECRILYPLFLFFNLMAHSYDPCCQWSHEIF